MCHSSDSRPPAPPNPGPVAEHGPLTLTAADGNTFQAYAAVPGEPAGRGIVILPDVRGLHPYYKALAERFAEAGYHAVAIDYFGRTADTDVRDDDFDFKPHVAALKQEHVVADATAAIAVLRQHTDGPLFSVGFCMGGARSWMLGAADLGLSGVIGFYSTLRHYDWDLTGRITVPVLGLLGGADPATTPEQYDQFAAALPSGTPFERHTYDGAPHSFFDRAYGDWQEACADSWRRILDFSARVA